VRKQPTRPPEDLVDEQGYTNDRAALFHQTLRSALYTHRPAPQKSPTAKPLRSPKEVHQHPDDPLHLLLGVVVQTGYPHEAVIQIHSQRPYQVVRIPAARPERQKSNET
jgi:hypothetical protein